MSGAATGRQSTPLVEALVVAIGALKLLLEQGDPIWPERHAPARETLDRFHRFLVEGPPCDGISVNMNDVFVRGADSFTIEIDEIDTALEAWSSWGDLGLIAFVAQLDGIDPLAKHMTPEYLAVRDKVSAMKVGV